MIESSPSSKSQERDDGLFLNPIGTAFIVLFGNLGTFMTISLLCLPFVVGVVILIVSDPSFQQATEQYGISPKFGSTSTSTSTSTTQPPLLETRTIVGLVLLSIPFAPVLFLASAVTIQATAQIRAGETNPKLGKVFRAGVRNVCRLFCFRLALMIPVLAILIFGAALTGVVVLATMAMSNDYGLQQTLGFMLFVLLVTVWLAVSMFVMIPFQIAPPSLVLEQRITVLGAFSRAWELSSGRRCDIFCCFFLLALINVFAVIIPILGLFWHLLFAIPMNSILATVLFLDFRVEKEGFTQTALRDELGMGLDDDLGLDLSLHNETELTMGKPGIVEGK